MLTRMIQQVCSAEGEERGDLLSSIEARPYVREGQDIVVFFFLPILSQLSVYWNIRLLVSIWGEPQYFTCSKYSDGSEINQKMHWINWQILSPSFFTLGDYVEQLQVLKMHHNLDKEQWKKAGDMGFSRFVLFCENRVDKERLVK